MYNLARMSVRVGFAWPVVCVLWSLLVAANPVKADEDPWLARDKGLHFGVSAAASASAYGLSAIWLERPVLRAVAGFSFALSLGLAKEGWDAMGHGHASLRDGTFDVVGSLAGAAIAWAVDRGVARLRKRCLQPKVGARLRRFHTLERLSL